jgi:hypothetical protein
MKTKAQKKRDARIAAEEKRNRLVMQAAEAEAKANEKSKEIYRDIWRAFSEHRKRGASFAYTNLMDDLTKFASHLVPAMMSAKEHMALIAEAESHMKGEGHAGEDPRTLIGSWLRGETDLSRIPLESKVIN